MNFTHRSSGATASLEEAHGVVETSNPPFPSPYATYLGERNRYASQVIREAIGEQALALLGAHNLRFPHDTELPYLSFSVRGSVKCNHLRVEMDKDDLFTVSASRQTKSQVDAIPLRECDRRVDIPAGLLLPVMERMTDIPLPFRA